MEGYGGKPRAWSPRVQVLARMMNLWGKEPQYDTLDMVHRQQILAARNKWVKGKIENTVAFNPWIEENAQEVPRFASSSHCFAGDGVGKGYTISAEVMGRYELQDVV